MATINYATNTTVHSSPSMGGVNWLLLTTTNADGQALRVDDKRDRSVSVSGTFGVGGTLVIQGSNDGVNWYTLSDLQGSALSFTAAGLKGVAESPVWIRPFISGGDGTTSLDVYYVAKG